jgi:hypothetical protein
MQEIKQQNEKDLIVTYDGCYCNSDIGTTTTTTTTTTAGTTTAATTAKTTDET